VTAPPGEEEDGALARRAAQTRQLVPAVGQFLLQGPVSAHAGQHNQGHAGGEDGRGQPQGGAGGAEQQDDKGGYGVLHEKPFTALAGGLMFVLARKGTLSGFGAFLRQCGKLTGRWLDQGGAHQILGPAEEAENMCLLL